MTAEEKQRIREEKKQRDTYYKGMEEQRRKEWDAAALEKQRTEAQNTVEFILTEKEHKLLNLALHPASPGNEWQSALIKFGESLRSRGYMPKEGGAR